MHQLVRVFSVGDFARRFARGSWIIPRSTRQAVVASAAALATLGVSPPVRADLSPLIPREALFPKPAAMQALRLSPDGRLLSYLAPDAAGVQQLWVRDLDRATARRMTDLPAPGVGSYGWAENNRIIYYEHRDDAGSRLAGIEPATGRERALIVMNGAQFGNFVTRPGTPDDLLLSLRRPKAAEDDVYRLNLVTGTLVLDTTNPGGVSGNQFYADHALRVRAVQRTTQDGGTEVLVRDEPSGPWRTWLTADSSYTLTIEGFSGDGEALLLRTDLGADTARLVSRVIRDGAEHVIASGTDLDVENVLLHPRTGAVQAVSYLSDPRRWEALEPSIAAEFERIGRLGAGQVGIASRDRADTRWLVRLADDRSSPRSYLWDRATRKATLLFVEQPHLSNLPLARMQPVSFKARDGLLIHGYLTLPVGVPARQLPLVVWVHGGPYLRDSWGYDHVRQLFADRGYAFLRVNFRGSRGYGRRFRLAGFKQWGRAMQDDVVDAVEFVVRSGVADRSRMAILGHSYGGYSALAALTMTPDLFACGAASSTIADLVAFVDNFPRTPANAWVRETIGDAKNSVDAAALRSVSPLTLVDRLRKPLLIARGDRDGALPSGDMDTFVAQLERRGRQVTSIVYEGDGHFFRRENQLDFFARVEALFARHLGGRAEPMADHGQSRSTGRVTIVGR